MNTLPQVIHRTLPGAARRLVRIGLVGLLAAMAANVAWADGLITDYEMLPPLISTLGSGDKPNVLVVLDNSNSMDEDASGQAVGSANANSKSEIARHAIKSLITGYTGKIRMGLMAYQQDTAHIQSYALHNSPYDISFDPANYDPTFTGSRASTTKRFRSPKPGHPDEYVYYNIALPFYAPNSQGTAYCYSNTAQFDNGSETYPGGPWDNYRCYSDKTGTSDTLPAADGSNASTYGWSGYFYNGQLSPTDSDLAQNILDFGRFLSWYYVSPTWFNNTSPGKGFLHVPIATLDATQAAKLDKKLDTSQFTTNAPTDPNYPLENAGLTPMAGTLETAKNYFSGAGTLPSSETAVYPSPAVPSNTCGSKDFVILVTDGLPSTDDNGNTYSSTQAGIDDVAAKAAALKAAGVRTYVVGFALPATVDQTLLDQIASAGGTSQAYYANDPTTLSQALDAIFQDLLKRTSSATNAAVVSNSASGYGGVYQALYTPELARTNPDTGVTRTVSWVGTVNALFVDTYGMLREDTNGNHQLDDYSTDKIIKITYNSGTGQTEVVRYNSTSPTVPTGLTVAQSVPLDQLKPIWSARDSLAHLNNSNIINQRSYNSVINSTGAGRYIFTWIDSKASGTAGAVDSGEVIPFTWSNGNSGNTIDDSNYRYLGVSSTTDAENIVDYVRGYEGISGYRSRTIDYDLDGTDEAWRLGDIVDSTPAVVGAPSARYDLLYNDSSYAAFYQHYLHRRQVVYVGANDGMLHAFNGGFWDETNKRFVTQLSGETAQPLGSELWAYVPQALLPQLQWLKDPNYPHVFYVDGAPQQFDVNIFPNDADHPHGWGTILVVGLRFGGGPFSVDTNGDGTKDTTLRSSYIIMDVTNPEVPPTLIAEISDAQLGFTTGKPALVKARVPGNGVDWDNPSENLWYLVFGSGPTVMGTAESTQNAQLYAYDLVNKTLLSGWGGGSPATHKDTGETNSFTGEMSSVDWDLDFIDDGVYFGIVSGSPSSPSGKLDRLHLNTSSTTDTVSAASLGTLLNTSQPFTAAPWFSRDPAGRYWVYAGTGRMLVTGDNSNTTQHSFYGLKEPVDATTGLPTWGSVSSTDLQNVTSLQVFGDGSITPSPTTVGTTQATTFTELQNAMTQKAGWMINFANPGSPTPSTRNVTSATQDGELLLFSDYTPSTSLCSPEGTSNLWAVNYQTGTAMPYGALGFSTTSTNNGYYEALRTLALGQGLAGSPIVHRGAGAAEGKITVFTQTSTGQITGSTVKFQTSTSGRESWRELYF